EARPEARRLLEVLDDGRAHPVSDLANPVRENSENRNAGRSAAERWLKRLESEGFVRRVEQLVGRADASRTGRTVRVTPWSSETRAVEALTAKQRAALGIVGDFAAVEESVAVGVLDEAGVTSAVLGALARKGFVSIGSRKVERISEHASLALDD